MITATPGWA